MFPPEKTIVVCLLFSPSFPTVVKTIFIINKYNKYIVPPNAILL